ncbi:hypothetical protein QTP88_021751 [Uroleucon formosanum]
MGGARVKSPRVERAPAASRPITYQNKTGFFTQTILVQCEFCAIKVNREETELAPFGCIRDIAGRLLEMHVKNGGGR